VVQGQRGKRARFPELRVELDGRVNKDGSDVRRLLHFDVPPGQAEGALRPKLRRHCGQEAQAAGEVSREE